MKSPTFLLAWYRFRTTLARSWGVYLAVVLLIGLIGGIGMASIAGARRTESAFPKFLVASNSSNLQPQIWNLQESLSGPATANFTKQLSHLGDVEHVASSPTMLVAMLGRNGKPEPIDASLFDSEVNITGSTGGMYFTSDRVGVIAGRLADPSRANEMDATASAARILGWHVGETVTFGAFTPQQAQSSSFNPSAATAFSVVSVKLVGLVVFADQVAHDDVDRYPTDVLLTPALTKKLQRTETLPLYGLQLKNGNNGVGMVEREIVHALPKGTVYAFHVTSIVSGQVERASKPEALALGVFGLIASLAALLIGGLTIARRLWSDGGDLDVLRALGASSYTVTIVATLGLLGSLFLGSIVAGGVAILLSPVTLVGPVRQIEPSPGFNLDWTVLGVGVAVLVLGLSAMALVVAFRRARRRASTGQEALERGSALVNAAAGVGLWIPALVGLRFALQRGRGRTAVPVRSVLVGSVLAVLVVTATLVFGSSLSNLDSHPALYGWNWNYAISTVAGGSVPPITGRLLDHDPDVASWTGFSFGDIEIDGQTVPTLSGAPHAALTPTILLGHALDGPNQLVVGAATLEDLHKKVGDTVTISYGSPQNAPIYVPPTPLVIVGTATFPAIGTSGTFHTSMGTGVLFDTNFAPAFSKATSSPDPNLNGPAIEVVRLRSGVPLATALASLRRISKASNRALQADPNAAGDTTSVEGLQRPAEIVAYQSTGATPTVLASGLVVGVVAALGLALASSVRRRRRELALLKTFGFTRRQLASAVAWQSSLSALIGVIFGVPLGILVGRWLWIIFAREIYAVPEPTVPVLQLVYTALGALVLANLVAALPGRIAARTSTALVLRAD
jgi:hypothetical protein